MAPKRKPPTSSGAQPKKQRCVPTLEEKLAVLDLLRNGMSIANVARKHGRNESSIRAIKIREREIRQAVASRNVQTTGEAASANEEAAKAYPEQLKKIIEEMGYLPEQVFNADETGLFWKKMPTRTYISKSERQAPCFKAAKDHVTVLLCGNVAGHLIKPGLLYRAANPRALKGKNKNLLPVFWQSNKKTWVTAALFLDWFHKCFILEVKQYLEEKGLDFKVLLIVDNAPGHPAALRFAHNDVEVVFLPPNATSILQPLDQGVISCFKATYTRLTFSWILTAMDADPNVNVMECWKSFNIADCITYLKQAMDAIKPETVNASKHLNDLMSEYAPFMERSLKITRSITDDLRPYQEMFEELKRQQRQLPVTMFLKKKQPAAAEPTQSTSRAEPEPTISPTTRSPSPKPGPSSPGSTSSPDDSMIVLSGEEEDFIIVGVCTVQD
ncbi:tigger transposable element-derived protein 1-like [Emys orbicularis]|uniref:tigger transposable element-derived protein 1-like n=1 Tax=Emys orbicularis TaxID=82168 RepID=UPI0031FD946B